MFTSRGAFEGQKEVNTFHLHDNILPVYTVVSSNKRTPTITHKFSCIPYVNSKADFPSWEIQKVDPAE